MRKTEGRACVMMRLRNGRRSAHNVAFRESGFGLHLDDELIAGLSVPSWVCTWEDELHPIAVDPEGCVHCEVADRAEQAQHDRRQK